MNNRNSCCKCALLIYCNSICSLLKRTLKECRVNIITFKNSFNCFNCSFKFNIRQVMLFCAYYFYSLRNQTSSCQYNSAAHYRGTAGLSSFNNQYTPYPLLALKYIHRKDLRNEIIATQKCFFFISFFIN